MKKRVTALVGLLVFLSVLGYTGVLNARAWVMERLLAPNPAASENLLVEIPSGSSTFEIADLLHRRGLVKDPVVFRYYARFRKLDARIQGGLYTLSAAMTPEQILQKMANGEVVVRRFTVPEGLTVAETANHLGKAGVVDPETFVRLASASRLAEAYLPKGVELQHPLEGYLFPSTYDYKPGIREEEVLRLMFTRFEQVWTPQMRGRAAELKLTIHQVITLASIIEKEARVAKERPVIAGVYHNRMRVGMKLDADPTVRYALNKPPTEPLLYKDLEVESPYNTYRVATLPPGPIAAPGESAIKAALYPDKHDLWYFVAKADGTGEHYFAETLQQHDENTAKAEANQKK